MKKKVVSMLLAGVMALGMLAGCGDSAGEAGNNGSDGAQENAGGSAEDSQGEEGVSEGEIKTINRCRGQLDGT